MTKKNWLICSILVMAATTVAAGCQSCRNPKSIFVPRSQGYNMARELANEAFVVDFENSAPFKGYFSTAFEGTRSFKPKHIVDYFFGRAANNGTVVFSGSTIPNRGEFDILADYFGLPMDFRSEVKFRPRISN